jgi:hypothetical protein
MLLESGINQYLTLIVVVDIVTDLINALPGNSSLNSFLSVSAVTSQQWIVIA